MTELPEDQLRGLIGRAAENDEAACRELIERFYPRIREHVHQELQQDFRKRNKWMFALFSTRDVVQEVFGEVVRNLDGCDFPNEKAFVSYLKTMVRNRLLDMMRFHQADKRDERRRAETPTVGVEAFEPARGASPELAAVLAEQVDVLRDVMGTFPLRQRTLLEMRLVDDATFPVIAGKLGFASEETARQAFWEAKAKLLLRLRQRGVRAQGDTLQ